MYFTYFFKVAMNEGEANEAPDEAACDEGDELYYEDYEDEKYGSEPALMIDASALVSLSTVDIFLMN